MEGHAARLEMTGIDPAIRGLSAFALALIFGTSGAIKLRDLDLFEGSLVNYHLAPTWMEKPLTYLLPLLECAGAAGLLLPSTRATAAMLLFALLSIFTIAIAVNHARGRSDIDCGCFGPALRQRLSGWLLVRNAFLTIIAIFAMLPENGRTLESVDVVTIAMGAATLTVLYASANFAIGNAPKTRALEQM
jgi:hypothetical protein